MNIHWFVLKKTWRSLPKSLQCTMCCDRGLDLIFQWSRQATLSEMKRIRSSLIFNSSNFESRSVRVLYFSWVFGYRKTLSLLFFRSFDSRVNFVSALGHIERLSRIQIYINIGTPESILIFLAKTQPFLCWWSVKQSLTLKNDYYSILKFFFFRLESLAIWREKHCDNVFQIDILAFKDVCWEARHSSKAFNFNNGSHTMYVSI